MTKDLIPVPHTPALAGLGTVPALFTAAGEQASYRYLEFFTATIRNRNTRAAYARAAHRFDGWCREHRLRLQDLTPIHVAAYVEQLGTELDKPSIKQHLAALRMLFDHLVTGQVLPSNPAASVRGPKYVVIKGKTTVLNAAEARQLLDSIDHCEDETGQRGPIPASQLPLAALRDRALIGAMLFSFARISAVLGMDVEDYCQRGKRWWLRLHEKGGKHHEVPAHHKAEEYLDAYLQAAGLAGKKGTPLFRSFDRRGRLTDKRLDRREALAMIKRRARAAGLGDSVCCHTFRATGITAYLRNKGTIEKAAAIAAHNSPRTTKLYDRTSDEVSLDEIEKIVI